MNIFYIPYWENNLAIMDSEESHHCARVLRMQKGDPVSFIDGKGTLAKGILKEVDQKSCKVEILEKSENYEKRPYFLHIAIAPTKSNDRFEWFLEKATEIGVDRITPIVCEHSERRKIRAERLERVILSAVKQSVKAWLPQLDPFIGFKEFINESGLGAQKYIAHCREGHRTELIRVTSPGSSVLLLIGPEGDFSEEEIMFANKKGFKSVSLGKSRLRTETAGVVAAQICSDIQYLAEL